MNSELPKAGWKDRILLFTGRRIGFEVVGGSMLPTLKTGDRVLIDTRQPIATGNVVLAKHPYKKGIRMIKRVASIDPDGCYFLTGDNGVSSTDSQTFGKIAAKDILGKVICRF